MPRRPSMSNRILAARKERNEIRQEQLKSKKEEAAGKDVRGHWNPLNPADLQFRRWSRDEHLIELLKRTPHGREILTRLKSFWHTRAAIREKKLGIEPRPKPKSTPYYPTQPIHKPDPNFLVNSEQLRARFRARMPDKNVNGTQIVRGLLDNRPPIMAQRPFVTTAVAEMLMEPLSDVFNSELRREAPKDLARFRVYRLKLARNIAARAEIVAAAIENLEKLARDDPEYAESYRKQANELRTTLDEYSSFAKAMSTPLLPTQIQSMMAMGAEHREFRGKKKKRK